MASKEELSDQLALTQKLAAATDQMSRSMSRIEASYDTQIAAIEKLTRAIEQLKSIDLGSINNVKLGGLLQELKKTDKTTQGLTGKLKDMGLQMSKKVPTSAVAAAAGVSGLAQGFRNVIAMTKGIGGFFASFVTGAGSIAASIIAIPFKMFNALVDTAAASAGGMSELAEAIENLRKEMGDLKGPGTSAVMEASKTLQGFSDTGLSTWRVFGTLAERIQLVTKVAVAMGATFGVMTKEFKENGGAILAFQKGLGASDEQMKAIGDRAITMGKPMSRVFLDMTKQTLALGKAFDIDQKLIGKDMAKAMQNVKHFGALAVKEIAQASVYSRKLGVELDKITGTLDAFETFDSAAENAAKLSQSFGVSIDAFKMMEAQNPAEQLDMLRKSFKDAGIDSSKFTRQQAKLLATSSGLDEATVRQAFSTKNYGVSLDDVKKKSESAEKKTMTQQEAMSKLADSIERLVKAGGPQPGGFFEAFFKGIIGGLQSTKEFYGIMRNIQVSLVRVRMIGVELGRLLPRLVPGLGDFLGGWRDMFSPAKFTGLFRGIKNVAVKYLKKGPESFPEMMDELRQKFFDFFNASSPAARKIFEGFKKIFVFLGKTAAHGIKWVTSQLKNGLITVIDLLTGKTKLDVKGPAAGEFGFLSQALLPIFDSLNDAWKVLSPKVLQLLKIVGNKIAGYMKSPEFMKIVGKAAPVIAVTLFGPMFGRAVLGALATSLIKGVFGATGRGVLAKVFTSGIGKVLGPIGIAAAVGGVAINVGKSIRELKGKISDEFDGAEKTIAAGATGVLDALTLGLIPESLKPVVANFIAGLSKSFFESLSNTFGKGFGESLKQYFASQIDFVGKIGDTLAALISGDEDAFMAAASALGKQLILMTMDGMNFMASGVLPFIAKTFIQVGGFVERVMLKTFASISESIAEKLGPVFGKPFKMLSEGLRTQAVNLKEQQGEIVEGIDEFGKKLNEQHKKQRAKAAASLGVGEDVAKSGKTAAKSGSGGVTTPKESDVDVESATQKIEKVQELQKKLSDKKFDIEAMTTGLRAKLDKVDFKVIKPEQLEDLEASGKSVAALEKFSTSTSNAFDVMSSIPKNIDKAVTALKLDAVQPALMAVSNMVKLANELDATLGAGMKVDVPAKLTKMAQSMGLGSKASYTIRNKDVVINMNVQVTMNVDDVEKVMILREKSFVRDRINYMLGTDETGKNSKLPATPSSPTEPFIGGTSPAA